MNVKKSGGTSISDMDAISEYTEQTRKLLLRQIIEIEPTYIMTRFHNDLLTEHLFNIELQRSSRVTLGYGIWKVAQVVNFFHPSSEKKSYFTFNLQRLFIKGISKIVLFFAASIYRH